ncbi:hypothetical protein LEP1GSC060_1738 [Leptospira weilii serovar Ranarum str. ICFT]|uniref:Uncharacterized protein n=1 Tax=Leptospira weilii serovar Ranarum str. ICFT TaxID=1218598 RepID=N1WQK8_9LEPT|nr:hypothetical protein LEP1GSC060_1738 [Leptospira weilii serovar Ranarum str. ICFT]
MIHCLNSIDSIGYHRSLSVTNTNFKIENRKRKPHITVPLYFIIIILGSPPKSLQTDKKTTARHPIKN